MLTKKIHRQEPTVAIAPPRAGATTGAASAGHVSSAMARTRSVLALKRSTASLPTGTIMRAADALQHPHADQHRQRHAERAPQRRER